MSKYNDQLQRDCCLDAMRDTPVSYTCERRSEYIVDGAACVEAFLHCCKEIESQRAEKKEDSLLLARSKRWGQGMEGSLGWSLFMVIMVIRKQSLPPNEWKLNNIFYRFNDTLGEEEDNSYMDSNEIVSRTKFPESWLWSDFKLPPCPDGKPNWWVSWNL